MADDRIQRPIRASQPPMRSAPPVAQNSPTAGGSGNDPLAELARLIGQNDPFAEYGRENARRAAPPPPEPALATHHDNYNYQQAEAFAPTRGPVPGYRPDDSGYEHDAEYRPNAHTGAEEHDYYDDAPPRRRFGILAIAAVFALAVIGTAGAFGYRALFGSSAASGPPPVIKAETAPTKIVPAANSKDPKSGKLIYDRVAERGQDEKLVSREERPVDRPTTQDQAAGSIQPPPGSGIVATEPKKVHTIAIRPDGTTMAEAAPTPVVASPPPRAQAAEPAPRQAAARPEPAVAPVAAPPPHRAAAPAPNNAPLSLSPDAQPQAAPAPRATRTAVAAPPAQIAPSQSDPARPAPASAPAGGGSGYAVQVSSQRSEGEAQAAFRNLQAKFPGQLGGKQAIIRQVDLGAKGTYYRAMVGPLGSDEANQLCSSLKAAGGQCIVQRI